MSRQLGALLRARSRRMGTALGAAALLLSLQVSGIAAGFTMPITARAASAPSGHPNHVDASLGATTVRHAAPRQATAVSGPVTALPPEDRRPSVPMQPTEIALTPAGGTLLGSDSVLEIDIPAGAVTASDVTAAGGAMSLLARQVLPASGGTAGGSGRYTFGMYLLQVLDAKRQLWSGSLHAALGMQLHPNGGASALDLTHTVVVLNQSLPPWFDATPLPAPPPVTPVSGARQLTPASAARTAATPAPRTAQPALGKRSSVRATVSSSSGGTTLSAPVTMSGSSMTMSSQTPVSVASFGKPDPFEPGLSSGSLAAGYPLDVPAGPGGLTPQVVLGYSSASLNDQHSPQAAAPWVGEGWSLSLGSISWAEHSVAAPSTCNPSQTTCPSWDSTWELSDAYGTAAELVPPSQSVSTYYDDSTYAQTPSPVAWHTAPETHARVISFNSPVALPNSSLATPCFRVFLPSGIMEEFGCTSDSILFYQQGSGANAGRPYIAGWNLDLITDPQGNQVHVSYQQDVVSGTSIVYARDEEMATVEYDSPGCHDAQNRCTGSAWAPLMRVSFQAGHQVAHVLGSSCAQSGSLRCDDPADLSGSGGLGVPLVQSTFVLNDALVQTRGTGDAGWSTLRDYQFSYEQSGPSTITDPFSGSQESVAGKLDLTQLKTIGGDGATALPPSVFGYTQVPQYYEDSSGRPTPTTNCGPSGSAPAWNPNCWLWSQSYAGNSFYLSTVSNGLGLAESFGWANARSNSSLANQLDPMYCNANQGTAPCSAADDSTWSRIVLASKTDTVQRVSQAGQGSTQTTTPVAGTTSYTYQLAPWMAGCPGCQGMYWRSSVDRDQSEFYNDKFMGFAQTAESRPDSSVYVHRFLAGEGQGVYDAGQVSCTSHCGSVPWWDLANAAHMHEYELDRYDTNGTTLLSEARTTWQAVCPPSGVSGSPAKPGYGTQGGMLVSELDQGTNPTAVCDIQRAQVDEVTFDGATGASVPDKKTTYAYDNYGRATSQSTLNTTGVFDYSGHGNHAVWSGAVTLGAPDLVTGDSGTAMSLDGSTGEIDTGYRQSAVSAYSVEAWVKTTDGGSRQSIVEDRGAGGGQSLTLQLSAGKPYFELESNYLEIGVFSSTAVNDGQAHHLVGTWSGGGAVTPSQFTLYVDGVAVTTSAIVNGSASAPLNGLGGTKIGAHEAWGTHLGGTVDEVAVYGGVLSAARVSAHHSAGSGYKAAVLADSPLAYWRLDDGAGGTNAGPSAIVNQTGYVQNDSVTATASSATGHYLVDYPADSVVQDPSGNRYQCSFSQYDGMGWVTGQQSGLTLGEPSRASRFTGCGTPANGFSDATGPIATTSAYDVFGNLVGSSDADANAGVGGHTGCAVGSTSYSACTTVDSTFGVLPTSAANALGQTSTTGYQTPDASPTLVADSSGHGLQGTRTGGVVEGVPGLVSGNGDKAMSFDGSTGTIPLNLSGIDTASGHQVTVELWMNWSGNGGSQMPFGFNGYDLAVWPGVGFGFNTANSDLYGVPMSAVPANTPLHVVAVFGNGGVSSNLLYINGVQQTLTQRTGTPVARSATAQGNISGWSFNSTLYAFSGALGEVAVYNGALSASRVSAHFGAGSGYQSAVLADSPLAYYRLNELGGAVADSSGHGLQASLSGGVAEGAGGQVAGNGDTAMSFDGSTGTIPLNLSGIDTTSGHQVTVEFWLNWSGDGVGGQVPFGFNGYDLDLYVGSGLGFNSNNSDLLGVPMSAVPANTPLHVVAVFTNGGMGSNKLYINGVQQTLTQLFGTPLTPSVTAASRISGMPSGGFAWSGILGQVAVYNGALPAARVSAHYTAGSGYQSAVLADSPLAYYRLNEGSATAAGGFGLWPTSTTDANGQTTSVGYDVLGRETSRTLPGESAGLTTTSTTYTVWCSGTSAQTPCVEVDSTQRLNSSTTVVSRSFYDGLGRLVETRSPAPSGQDVVRYTFYNPAQPQLVQSVPYLVAAYSGGPGAAAYSIPDSTVAGTTMKYDGLGRLVSSTDALSFQSSRSYAVACAPAGTGDGGCYEQTLSVDGNGHQSGVLVDALGRTAYEQRYTGNSSATYAVYATAKYGYDYTGDLVRITHPDGSTQTTFGYDMAGRKTSMSDPDLGAQTYSYDQDGSLAQSVDARGASGTIFAGYDGLDRPIWRNTANSPSGAYDTYGYDSTAGGSAGIGRLTSETFATGSLSGSYAYLYDGRGRQTTATLTMGTPAAPAFVQQASNHGANQTSLGATFGSNVSAGDRIVVVVGVWSAFSANASGVTDSAGNTYTKVAGQVAADGTEETIWTAPITAGGGTRPTVTATADASADIGIAAVEYSGVSRASGAAAVDRVQTASGTSGGGTVASGATAPATAGNELAVGAYVDSGFGDTLSYGSGWVGRVNVSPASDMELAVEDQGASLGSTPNAQVSTNSGSTWLMATAVFRSAAYTTQTGYDDAGNVLTQTYPDGQVVTNGYTAQGWLSSVATSQGSTTLASGLGYTGVGGAFGEVAAMHLGGGYDYSASYDLLDRASDLKTTRSSDGTVMFEQSRTFGAAGNVTSAQTTMPGATDSQAFCYDEQDRLTWASAQTATPPCGGSNTAGTLGAAQYTQSFTYDTMGRLATGPLGSYAYGSSAHMHAATSIGTGWTAAYDAAGNMTCRAPSQSSTCAGTPTGAQLAYNNEGELTGWQNTPTSPTTTAGYLYDGQGQRVAQQVTQSGTTTTTVYVGDVEEVATSGGATTTTAYYYAGGKRIGLSVNGVVSYLAQDALGSATVTLSSGGIATTSQLFAPYGSVRYSSGTMPTSYGFTGQRSDAASGLDYYGARYYDPLAGQFTSGDSVMPSGGFDLWGLSRYAYVGGNPVGRTDPTGHINLTVGDDYSAVPIDNAFQGTYSWGSAPVVVYHPGFTRSYPASRQQAQVWPLHPPKLPAPTPKSGSSSAPPVPALGHGYQTDWNLDISISQASPEEVMAYFQEHPRDVFPFALGSCDSIQAGERCDLSTPFPWSDSPVEITDVTTTSFTFKTLPGHFDAPGSTITFSVENVNGSVHLTQTGIWVLPDGKQAIISNATGVPAYYVWKQQASNLSHHMGGHWTGCGDGSGTCLYL